MRMKVKIVILLLLILSIGNLNAEKGMFEEGVNSFNKKDYSKTIEQLEKIADSSNTNLLIDYYLGLSYYYQKSYSKASAHLKDYLLKTPLDNFQRIRDALTAFFTIQGIERIQEETIKMGNLYLEKIEGRKSFERLAGLIKNNLTNAYLVTGNQFFYRKDYKEAKEFFKQVLLFSPQSHSAIEKIAVSDYFMGLYDEAEKNLVFLLETEKKNWRLLSSSSYYLTEIKDPEDDFLEKLAIKNPAASGILKAYRYFKTGNYDKSFAALKKIEEGYNTDGEIMLDITRKIGEPNFDAVRVYLLFVANYPLAKMNGYITGRVLVSIRGNENESEVKKELAGIIEKNIGECTVVAKLPELERLRVDVKFDNPGEREDLFRGKLAAYSEIVKKYPEGETAKNIMFNKAKMYTDKLGEHNKAISIFAELAAKNNYRNSSVELVKAHIQAKNYDTAIVLSKEFLKEHPENEQLTVLLGEALLANGETDESMTLLQKVYEKTPNIHTKNKLRSIFNNHEQIIEKKDHGLTSFVTLTLTETESYFSNVPDIKEGFPPLKQRIKSINIHPFFAQKQKFPVTLELISPDKPSLSEPATIYKKDTEGYKLKWETELTASNNIWRKILPFRVIYPWQEEKHPEVQIFRRTVHSEKSMTVEIEIMLSPGIWEIKVLNPVRGGKITEVNPVPDFMDNTLVSYANVSGHMKLKMIYPPNSHITNYYPEVVVNKTDILENRLIDELSDEFRYNGIYIKGEIKTGGLYVIRKNEKIFTMAERIDRR
jgi:tetratricopeptide (TPR) repeat protein